MGEVEDAKAARREKIKGSVGRQAELAAGAR